VTSRVWLALLLLLACAAPAAAVETQLWITDAASDYVKADARGVVVGPDGVLALGPDTESSPADSLDVVWAIAVLPDGSVALAGDGGRVMRWTRSGGVRPWVRLPAGQVLSLARDGDGLLAGTGPGGLVYRITAKGDTSLFVRTGERYVWGLAPAGRGAWIAATGTRGRLLRLERGRATIALDTDESNLVSIASDASGRVFAGGDSKGRVFMLRADGSAATVFDAAEDEVRAVTVGPDGALYAAGLSSAAVTVAAGDDDDSKGEEAPTPVVTAPQGGRATVYRIVPDSSAAAVWTSPQPLVFALASLRAAATDGGPGVVAGTGNRAALFALGPAPGATQWAAFPQGQVTALASDAKGMLYAATSNPAALWRLGPERGSRGTLTGPVLDARRIARFGRVAWRGTGSSNGGVRIETHSGNTDPPDTTWSRWSEPGARSRAVSPAARYLQWRLTLSGGDPRVDAVEVAWKEENLAPLVQELQIAPQGTGFREGELQPRTEPVTQSLAGGQKVEYSISTTTAKALRGLPAFARGLRTIQWKGTDPNGDALAYKVEMRRADAKDWISIGDDLEATSFTWDTNALPDGRYRLRVVASDAGANAVGEARTGEALSEPFTVDNTPPAITAFEARPEPGAVAVSGAAEDAASLLTRVEVSLDDGDWRTVSPEGGLADDRALTFRTRLPDVTAGAHMVAMRAVDAAGNVTTRAAHVTVTAKR
jgi:hypothetical protein